MPPLTPTRRRANAQRRFNLNREIERLKNHYAGSYRGVFGRAATVRQTQAISNMIKELAARRIQRIVRARQARARAHTRARAPLMNIARAASHPRRVEHRIRTYGLNYNN